jgi:hypothetical protein
MYKEHIALVVFSLVAAFITIALFTFNITDQSWLYFNSAGVAIHNVAGSYGANSSAGLLYFFGAASWILLSLIWSVLVLCIFRVSLLPILDRIIVGISSIFTGALLLFMHNISFYPKMVPGGVVGSTMGNFILRWFDFVGAWVFVYC